MKRNTLKVLLIASFIFLGLIIGAYGFLNNFNFNPLITTLLNLPTLFYLYFSEFITTWNFNMNGGTAEVDYIILGSIGLSILLGLIALIRGFIVRRPIAGFLAFVSVIALVGFGTALIILDTTYTLPQGRFFYLILQEFSTDIINALFLVGILLSTYAVLLFAFILGLTARRRVKKAVTPTIPLAPTVNPTPVVSAKVTANPANPLPNQSPTSPNDNLSELVKAVMQEELTMMRNTQPVYPMPAMMPTNPYATNLDFNLIRRIVQEELAKFQGQYISRAEVQALIAQEVAMLQAQFKRK